MQGGKEAPAAAAAAAGLALVVCGATWRTTPVQFRNRKSPYLVVWWAASEVGKQRLVRETTRPSPSVKQDPLECPLVAGCETRSGHCTSSEHIPVVFFMERLVLASSSSTSPTLYLRVDSVSHHHHFVHTGSDERASERLKMECYFLPERIEQQGRRVKNRHTTDEDVWVCGGVGTGWGGAEGVEGEGTQPTDPLVQSPRPSRGCVAPRKVKGQPAAPPGNPARRTLTGHRHRCVSRQRNTAAELTPLDAAVAHPAPLAPPPPEVTRGSAATRRHRRRKTGASRRRG